ncbi:MAG: 1,4-dihydroxy-2-naphthoate polyprenyltransferase [Bacteroidales bacterium]|nr:1,4-dihydroxy-2-naphthoate polyprenyltransferase [Bacteroidales bacterium]
MNKIYNSAKVWVLAARPKTLPAAITPVLVGSALAYQDQSFQWIPSLICLVFALLAQIISNFANDYFDFRQGVDNEDRLGPKRAVSEGWIQPKTMAVAILILVVIDGLLGLSLVYYAGWQLILVGIIIGLFALAYSGGPYPLAYHGWGDVCVLIFFGVIPVGFTYYVQTLQWTMATTICGIAVGLAIINILVANNYRDRDTDKKAGKNTTLVLFGEKFGRYFYLLNGIVAVGLCQYFWFTQTIFAALLPLIYLFFHMKTWKEMIRIYKGKELIKILGRTAQNALLFGILLSIGLIAG